MSKPAAQRGAALLLAMLCAAVVASIAATATWRVWQIVQVEHAEQDRAQMAWLLQGALDWARLLLREDARAKQRNAVDHLNEPWALPLQEARLSSFLAARDQVSADLPITDAFLSGRVIDEQSRFNLNNLWDDQGQPSPADLARLMRLSQAMGVAPQVWQTAMQRVAATSADAVLRPQRLQDWARAGVAPQSIAAMDSVLTVLPGRTTVNLNTASATVLAAVLPQASLAQTTQWVRQRRLKPYDSLADWQQREHTQHLDASALGVTSDYFQVTGRLRIGDHNTVETSLLRRQGLRVGVLWRQRRAHILGPSEPAPGATAAE